MTSPCGVTLFGEDEIARFSFDDVPLGVFEGIVQSISLVVMWFLLGNLNR